MSQQEKHPFIIWLDEVETETGWTDNKWTTFANLSASVLNNARNKGVIPKWDACYALALAANKSPITAFRKAGLLPPGPDDNINFEDWQYLLEKATPDEREEMRQIFVMKIERRHKAEQTERAYLLDIPDLLDVVHAWDRKVSHMAPTSLWYATLDPGGTCLHETARAIRGRASVIGDDLRPLCQRAGVEYKSPHKFRHGHIVYARGLARNMEEVKAISQNVLHANAIITDQVYSALTNGQVQTTIASLGKQKEADTAELLRLLDALRAQIS